MIAAQNFKLGSICIGGIGHKIEKTAKKFLD